MRRSALSVFVLAVLAVFPASAVAVPTITGEFALGPNAEPKLITAGPDGNMWMTLAGATTDDVARITPDGTVTQFNLDDIDTPVGITAGPDGNLWVTGPTCVGRFSPSNPTDVIKTTINGVNSPEGIITGPDGKIWTASGEDVFRIDPTNPQDTGALVNISGLAARGLASGTDGRIWVADQGGTINGRVIGLTAGATPIVTPHSVGGGVIDVAAGPSGQVAFTNPFTVPNFVGLIVNGGTHTPVPMPITDPSGIAFGADGAYWTARFGSKDIARVTTDAQTTTLAGFSPGSGPRDIAAGPGNTLWVTLEATNKVARVSGVDPAPTDSTAPVVSQVSLTRAVFAVGSQQTVLTAKAKKQPTGTTLGFTASEAGTAAIRVERVLPGRISKGQCVKPRRSLRRAKKCKRNQLAGTLQRAAIAGPNQVAFSGRLANKPLKPGAFRFVITVTDASGNISQSAAKAFRIVKKKRK